MAAAVIVAVTLFSGKLKFCQEASALIKSLPWLWKCDSELSVCPTEKGIVFLID